MSLIHRYHEELVHRGYKEDSCQLEALTILADLNVQLQQFEQINSKPLKRLLKRPELPKSIYFWGGVGRGKTFLMDLFFESLGLKNKRRVHFHRFMQMIHQMLAELKHEKNPIDQIIRNFAKDVRILCLDEFFVSDIGDAMILSNILNACYEQRIVIVTTSNIYPEGLYQNGLQRDRFVPAIKGIVENFVIFNLDGGVDYRLRALKQASLYFFPLQDDPVAFADVFLKLIPDLEQVEQNAMLDILGRKISARKMCDDVLWISFAELCQGPRSQNDYIELGKLFHAVFIDGVRVMGADQEDIARRFINMIDEFYDRGVKVVIHAEAAMQELYRGSRLAFEFERTLSRLLEMQSEEYLALPHRPD